MYTGKRAMDNFDFLSDLRFFPLLYDADPLFKGWITQHTEFNHLLIGYFHRKVCILMFQNIKGSVTFCQKRTKLVNRQFLSYKNIVVNDRNQKPPWLRFVTNLFFRIPHRYKTRKPFLFQEITHFFFVSVKGANHHPILFFLLHFLPFYQQGTNPLEAT